jgi:hypothetical protein
MIVRITVAEVQRNPTEPDSVGVRSVSDRLGILAFPHETALCDRLEARFPSGSMSRCINHGTNPSNKNGQNRALSSTIRLGGTTGASARDSLEVLNCEQCQYVSRCSIDELSRRAGDS